MITLSLDLLIENKNTTHKIWYIWMVSYGQRLSGHFLALKVLRRVAISHQDLREKCKQNFDKGTYKEANPSNMRREY